jgi:DNA-binding HxlR family transcriptional regulator
MAHALDLVGDRWSLLVIRELMHGPKRYTDLVDGLPGIGTNILAARLRDLEQADVVARRTLPPPAASKVYELTDYGRELRPAMRELALWGAGRSAPRRRRPACSTGGSRTRSTSSWRRWRRPDASSSAWTARWPRWSTVSSCASPSTTPTS